MRIGILSRKASLYSTRRLAESARRRGHRVRVVDYLRCSMSVASGRPGVLFRRRHLEFDAVIGRIGAKYTFYGTALIRQFEMMGVCAVNSSLAFTTARDKLRSLQLLARAGVDMPVTGFASAPQDIDMLIETVGGAPLVVKLLEGTQGVGVVLAESRRAAGSVIAALRDLDADILIQEFIAEAGGADLRVFVVGDSAIAAMRREAPAGDFRANLHAGATGSRYELSDQERRIAIEASRVLGLDVAGVDLILSERGPLVLEVNASPGLEGIENVTGVDVANAIVELVEKKASAERVHRLRSGSP